MIQWRSHGTSVSQHQDTSWLLGSLCVCVCVRGADSYLIVQYAARSIHARRTQTRAQADTATCPSLCAAAALFSCQSGKFEVCFCVYIESWEWRGAGANNCFSNLHLYLCYSCLCLYVSVFPIHNQNCLSVLEQLLGCAGYGRVWSVSLWSWGVLQFYCSRYMQ